MPFTSTPRPILLAAMSFLAYWALIAWSVFFVPIGTGVGFDPQRDAVFVRGAMPVTPAYQAGIRAGDRILELNGLPLRGDPDVRVALANLPVGESQHWRLERAGATLEVVTPPMRRAFLGRRRTQDFANALVTSVLFVPLAMGIFIAVKRPRDTNALLAAWLLASVGCVSAPLWPQAMATAWRSLPGPLQWLPWFGCLSTAFVHLQIYALFSKFPRRVVARRTLALTILPGALVGVFIAIYLLLTVYAPARAVALPMPPWLQLAGPGVFPVYMAAGIVSLWRQRRGLEDRNDRRRVQILLAGAGGAFAALSLVAAMLGASVLGIDLPLFAELTTFLVVCGLFLLLPLSFGYVILRDRLFDVRVIIRLGLQYALARGALLSVPGLVAAALVIDVMLHGNETVRDVVARRGWVYGVLGGSAVLVSMRRTAWLAALDRRFFREKYAAHRVLSDIVHQGRHAGSVQSAAADVTGRIESALHPAVTAILLRPAGAFEFTACGTTPLPPLSAGSAIVKLLRALDRPLTVAAGDGRGLWSTLPEEARTWLAATRVELLVPIAVGGDSESVLALGAKRSEEPYSAEDIELLAAIGSSLSLLGGAPASPAAAASPIASPKRIGRRYEVLRLLGRGGMGAVYEARDLELDRIVAVKVIGDDFARRPDAADRFRREARAAASFTHPNVVTVHDFGLADGAPYLVMERLVGATLRERLRASGRLAGAEAVHVLRGAAAGIDEAHRVGLIHRDLKPENIFLPDGSGVAAKLLDFGIARVVAVPSGASTATGTASGVLIGSVAYMAPEQIQGGTPASAWDIWALGVTAYECLTGARPFSEGAALTSAAAILSGRWTPVWEHLPGASGALQTFFVSAFSLDPAERPKTASAAVESLAECLRV